MRILLVTNTYPPADITGVGALAHELKAALRADGHDASVLTRSVPAGEEGVIATGGGKLLFPMPYPHLVGSGGELALEA